MFNIASLSDSKPNKTSRTTQIITDENQYSSKLYFSLLKSQIFLSSSSQTKSFNENLNKKNVSYTHQKNTIHKKDDYFNNNNLNNNLSSIVKNLNKIFCDSTDTDDANHIQLISNSNQKKEKKNNFNLPNSFYSKPTSLFDICNTSHSKTYHKYTSLLNFEIDDTESTFNFFRQKKIPKTSYKVLDSPNIKDDFYLHLIDWSSTDGLAVGLDKSLYVWEGKTSKVKLITTLSENDSFSSVSWLKNGDKLVTGTNNGLLSVWDIPRNKKISEIPVNSDRIDVIAPKSNDENGFAIGLLNKSILTFDIRVGDSEIGTMKGHSQEVCGLKWSYDDRRLASGGNDNKLIIWNSVSNKIEHKFTSHTSAVKAIDWSPHKFGYLLSGGGTQDRTIKLWNTNTMTLVDSIDTHSQVCNVAFSKISHEFVSTHGYSKNYILVWDSEKMNVKATLKGHKDRVIYMSLGPDSRNIVTGAGDETIRFWNVFLGNNKEENNKKCNIWTEDDNNLR